jgi:hypothetical protein
MNKCVSSGIAVSLLSFCSIAAAAQEPPKVKIPEPGVPQIMTMEGRYVRVAYNNEGYAILGYKLANLSVGEEWMLLEVGVALREHVPDYVLKRDAVSLELPDGKTIPLASNKEYVNANLSALQMRAKVQRDSITTSRTTRTMRAGSASSRRSTSARCPGATSSSPITAPASAGSSSRCRAGSPTGSTGST